MTKEEFRTAVTNLFVKSGFPLSERREQLIDSIVDDMWNTEFNEAKITAIKSQLRQQIWELSQYISPYDIRDFVGRVLNEIESDEP